MVIPRLKVALVLLFLRAIPSIDSTKVIKELFYFNKIRLVIVYRILFISKTNCNFADIQNRENYDKTTHIIEGSKG